MTHWAYDYIGKPWRSGATGPDAYNCWGLAVACAKRRLGVEMPPLGSEHTLREAVTGWRRTDTPCADDLMVMWSPSGRHVGYMVEADGVLGVLHANGHETPSGPIGCVMFQTLPELEVAGFREFEFWRHQCSKLL